jgi:signal transduction histidine kinase
LLVVEEDDDVRAALVGDLTSLVDEAAELVAVTSGEEGLAVARDLVEAGVTVPVVFIERSLPAMSGAELALAMEDDPALAASRRVLVTSRASLADVDAALARGAVHGMLTRPWSATGLRDQLRAQLATYHEEHDPAGLAAYGSLIDDDARARARHRIELRRNAPPRPGAGGGRGDDVGGGSGQLHVLLAPQLSPEHVERLLVESLDRALGHPPRLALSPGSVLLEQGANVGGIYVILDGEVQFRRRSEAGERVVHQGAAGPIVGLLSLATQSRAFLEVKAVTEVRAIPLTLSQLARALAVDPSVGMLLTRALVNALANRLRDADELQVQLAAALGELAEAQATLVSQARLATLGELAAGIAHELNNPTAALSRAVEHVASDVDRLLGADDEARAVLHRARTAAPVSSAELRAARRALGERLGDRRAAEQMVAAGVTDPEQAARLMAAGGDELAQLTAANQLGAGLRNVATAAERIADLTNSLRAYLSGGEASPFVTGVSVPETVDDALTLVGHRLGGVSVARHYEPVPAITARPGPLQQVWTNLIGNALDALASEDGSSGGCLEVRIDGPEPGTVRVQVIDDGPGVAPEVREKLFTPHFTTKHGRVRFGSGLGLSICRQIVDDHGGRIEIESVPGRTVATVVLPVGDTAPVDPEQGRPR